jgi:hypothetical protein
MDGSQITNTPQSGFTGTTTFTDASGQQATTAITVTVGPAAVAGRGRPPGWPERWSTAGRLR